MRKYRNYQLLFTGGPDEHRLFGDGTGDVFVADRSGRTPSDTDDGALRLVRQGLTRIVLREGLRADMRVHAVDRADPGPYTVSLNDACARWLSGHWRIPLAVRFSDGTVVDIGTDANTASEDER